MEYPFTSNEYDRMRLLAISVILDYGITAKDYPLDMDDLCKRMNINVVPYSAYTKEEVEVLLKKSKDGFNVQRTKSNRATIYFNDKYGELITKQRISSTKGHELKHILEEDKDDKEDGLCEYFSRYLRCPVPYVKYLGIKSKQELISQFDISDSQAGYVLTNVNRHIYNYGDKFFDYEVVLLKRQLGFSLEIDQSKIMSSHEVTNGLFDELLSYYVL